MGNGILAKLKQGEVPLGVRQSAARGVLPVGQEELLAILIVLQKDPNPEVRITAEKTLTSEFSDDLLTTVLQSDAVPVEVLEYFGQPPLRSATVIETVVQNKNTPDSTIAQLAEQVASDLMDLILINLMRILRSPFILEALERNQNASADIRRRLREIREEFFEKRYNFIPVHRTGTEQRAIEQTKDVVQEHLETEGTAMETYSEELREGEDVTALTLESLRDDGVADTLGQERLSTIQKVARMTVAERVQAALKGTREERVILIRDANRIVSAAVLDSPKLSDSEVEAFSLMKNVSQEVLRVIGSKREFVKNYVVVHNLIRNPRTPIGISLTLLNRILTNDLRALSRNKNIPEVIRKMAYRQLQIRTAPKQSR